MNLKELLPNISEDVMAINQPPTATNTAVGDVPQKFATESRNKYKVADKPERTYNGLLYASKKEAQKAAELDLMVKAGKINFWLRQVPFDLGAGITYRADFVTYGLLTNSKTVR